MSDMFLCLNFCMVWPKLSFSGEVVISMNQHYSFIQHYVFRVKLGRKDPRDLLEREEALVIIPSLFLVLQVLKETKVIQEEMGQKETKKDGSE